MHRCYKDPRTRDLTHVKNWTTCSIVIYSLRVFFESNIYRWSGRQCIHHWLCVFNNGDKLKVSL